MPLSVQCPACKAKLNAPDSAAGKRVKCPKCQGPITIPGAATAAAAAPAAAANLAVPKARSPQPEPVRAAKPAPAAAPVVSAPKVAIQAAAAPVATAPPAAAPAKSGLPVLLIVLGVAILGGGVLLVGAIGIGAYVFMASGEPEGPPASPAALAGGPPAPPPLAAPAAPAPTLVQAAPQPPTVASVNWVAYENADKGFQAAFPGGQPQPIDPLAEIKDESQRELAAAMTEEMMLVGVTHGGRRYLLNAMPFDLRGIPPASYLDRMSAGIELVHQGFSVEPQPPADASAPQRDYVLKKGDAGKLLRVVVGRGHLYQLLIEGETGLGFDDPAAKEFFGRFQCAAVSSADVASSNSKSDADPSERNKAASLPAERPPDEAPANIDWRSAEGTQIAFTIEFPGITPTVADPLAALPERARSTLEATWLRDGLLVESLSAEVGDRRYAVTAFRHPEVPAEELRKLIGQMVNLTSNYVRYSYPDDRGRGYSAGEPLAKWQQWTTTSHALEDGRKAIVRQAQLGYYGFVVSVEGPASMDDLDPLALQFINSVQPPADSAPPPTETKPPARPSAKTKTKTKKNSK